MKCAQCDYPLWNIRARVCPECGGPFAPSQFRFAVNSVRFCCPHCSQEYYGTGADGHLIPRTFACVSCSRRIDMDEMVLLPAEGLDDRHTRADINPWLDPHRRFVARWAATLWRGMTNPVWLIRSTPVETSAHKAWLFALLSHLAFGLVMVAPILLLGLIIILLGGGRTTGPLGFGLGVMLAFAIVSLLYMVVWAAVTHIVLRLCGRTAGGMGRTAQAICFTCGPQMILLVPCIGIYFGWVGTLWWIIAAGFALAAAQRVSGLRAAIAVATVPIVLTAGLVAGVLLLGAGASGTGGIWTSTWTPPSSESVSAFALSINRQVQTGARPRHAGELLADGFLYPSQFVSPFSATMPNEVFIGGQTLDRLETMPPASRALAAAAAADALAPDTVAHRVGDFVFILDTVPHADEDPSLWSVIEWWDPALNHGTTKVFVLTVGGASLEFAIGDFQARLDDQNAARARVQLPPIPHPSDVRGEAPPSE